MRRIHVLRKAVVVSIVMFCAGSAARADSNWTNTSGGLWNTNTNWNPMVVPTGASGAIFDLANTYTVTFDISPSISLFEVDAGTVTFALGGRTLTTTAAFGSIIGGSPGVTGRLTVTDGTLSTAGAAIGFASTDTGILTISTGAEWLQNSGSFTVGASGNGTLTVNSGGQLSTISAIVGSSGTAFGAATVTGSGTQWLNTGSLTVGSSGTGSLTISSGGNGVFSGGNLIIGSSSSSSGTVTVSGSSSLLDTSSSAITVGSNGQGQLNISTGATANSSGGTIANGPSSSGAVTISGSGATWNAAGAGSNVVIVASGSSSNGTLTISGGGTLLTGSGTCTIGSGLSSSGTVTVTGNGSNWTTAGAINVGFNGTGTLNVTSGGTVTTTGGMTITATNGTLTIDGGTVDVGGNFTRSGALNFNDGTLIARGVYANGTVAGPLSIDGDSASALPTLELVGNFNNNNITSLTVGSLHQGALLLMSGRGFSTGGNNIVIGASPNASGSIALNPGTTLASNFGTFCYVGGNASAGGTGILTIGNAATLSTGTLVNYPGGTVNLNGGTAFLLGGYADNGGIFNWTSGQLKFGFNASLTDSLLTRFLGGAHSLVGGQTLAGDTGVNLTFSGPLNVNGGTLTSPLITNSSILTVSSGSVNSTGTAFTNSSGATTLLQGTGLLTAATAITNNGTLQLASSTAGTTGAGTLTNNGTIRGTGSIGNNLTNNSAGQVQLTTGNRLEFQGGTNTNSGLISLTGGEVVFTGPLTNANAASTGLISGRDAIIRTGGSGITNNGSLAFTAGTMDVYGDITNNVGGLITVSGGGTATFYDDVTIAAGASNVRATAVGSSVSKVVFFGSYNGGITGGGTAFIEGDHRPGNSPAIVSFGGDAAYGGLSRLFIEIGGSTVGTQFDQVHVTGQLALDGTLNVSLINSFSPAIGNSFKILDWTGGLSGTFSALQLPALTGKAWDTSQLYATGTLNVLPNRGDINRDTHVDIADVSALMTALSDLPTYQGSLTTTQLAEIADLSGNNLVNNLDLQGLIVYLANNAGALPAPSGASMTAVPEPSSALLVLIGSAVMAAARRRQKSRSCWTGYVLRPTSTERP
jgi:T5SS/PEP-CTERM-associated repeat protein